MDYEPINKFSKVDVSLNKVKNGLSFFDLAKRQGQYFTAFHSFFGRRELFGVTGWEGNEAYIFLVKNPSKMWPVVKNGIPDVAVETLFLDIELVDLVIKVCQK